MRRNWQIFRSLETLVALAILVSLFGAVPAPKAVSGQSIPTAEIRYYYFPLIFASKPVPVGPVGGTFTSFAIDPGQNDNIYAGHFGTGVYKTFDQGATWYSKSAGLGNLTIQSLATHPTDSDIVFAGTYNGGIYRSTNGGENWHAYSGGVLNNHIIYDIEIDPNNPQRMFAVSRISGSLRGYLSRSLNGGQNWTVLLTGDSFSSLDYFYDVDIDPANGNVIYLTAHEHGFYKSTNGGVNFSPINAGVSDLSARSFAIDSAHPGLVYGVVWHGSGGYRTWDSGASWLNRSVGLPADARILKVYADPFGSKQKRVFACTYGYGLYSSDNFADNWSTRGLSGQRIYDFVIADGNPQRWYAATENNGIFRSNSYGSNWNTIMSDLSLTAVTGLTDMPGDPEALAGSIYGQGVFRISDGGENWEAMNEGLNSLEVLSLTVADERLYAIGRGWLSLWDGARWNDLSLPEADAEGLGAAEDWVRGRALLPDEAFWMEPVGRVQPSSVAWQDGALVVGTAESGLWEVRGEQWQQIGLQNQTIERVFSLPGLGTMVIACGEEGSCGGYHLTAESLNRLEVPALEDYVADLDAIALPEEVKNLDPRGMTIAKSRAENCAWAVGNQNMVWVSKDCGQTWTAHSFDWTVQALAFDPLDAGVLLVGTREAGAYQVNVL